MYEEERCLLGANNSNSNNIEATKVSLSIGKVQLHIIMYVASTHLLAVVGVQIRGL